MSQSIGLGSVSGATFNGVTVENINLNGSNIWTSAAMITVGYRGRGSDSLAGDTWGYSVGAMFSSYASVGSISDTTPSNLNISGTAYLRSLAAYKMGSGHWNFTVQIENYNSTTRPFNTVSINGVTLTNFTNAFVQNTYTYFSYSTSEAHKNSLFPTIGGTVTVVFT
jgi:hypothetical protein